jgi:hypothetical protein
MRARRRLASSLAVLLSATVACVPAARVVAPPAPARPPPEFVRADIGCAPSTEPAALTRFFGQRLGPLLGADYHRAQPLPDGRVVWFVQDAFIDHSRTVATLDRSGFAHNAVLVQNGRCFQLVHKGTAAAPASFEPGAGETVVKRWWWALGTEVDGNVLKVFWVEMRKDPARPPTAEGLPYAPVRTWVGAYRTSDLKKLWFRAAANPAVQPIYGYSVASDGTHSYLFGNSYLQDWWREGGFWGAHSAVDVYLARVPRGRLEAVPEYWAGWGWTPSRADAVSISSRFWTENPLQPRLIDGRWIAVTKEDGFFGDEILVDVAPAPQGPWTTVQRVPVTARGGGDMASTYHAHLAPWRTSNGGLAVALSNNAWDMPAHGYSNPGLYRPQWFAVAWPPEPTVEPTDAASPTAATTVEPIDQVQPPPAPPAHLPKR